MRSSFYSELYSLLEKGDIIRRTDLESGSVELEMDGRIVARDGEIGSGDSIITETIKPEPHLVIFGAGHVSKAIAEMAHLLSMKVTIIDERKEMANSERFHNGEEIVCMPYNDFFASSRTFFRPYFIIVTHGHAYDRAALEWCLGQSYAYIGMIGSKGKVLTTFKALEEKGWSEEKLSSVHAPIGLSIGAVTPEEIAVSILSEIIGVFRETKYSVTLDPEYLKSVMGKKGIAARIVEKRGSAPRAVGSELFVTENGEVYGTVGGGKVELETIEEARRMLSTSKTHSVIHYNLSAKGDLGMICGGDVTMLFTKVE